MIGNRIFDEPGLFASGIGGSTSGDIDCDWCGTKYRLREGANGEGTGEFLEVAHFGKFQIVDCCFDDVERAVLDNMDAIIKWYRRILDNRRAVLDARQAQLKRLDKKQ